MLSQRMAKSWLMIERGVLPRRARLVLRQSVALFDRQLAELGPIADSAESRAARAELGEVWGRIAPCWAPIPVAVLRTGCSASTKRCWRQRKG